MEYILTYVKNVYILKFILFYLFLLSACSMALCEVVTFHDNSLLAVAEVPKKPV